MVFLDFACWFQRRALSWGTGSPKEPSLPSKGRPRLPPCRPSCFMVVRAAGSLGGGDGEQRTEAGASSRVEKPHACAWWLSPGLSWSCGWICKGNGRAAESPSHPAACCLQTGLASRSPEVLGCRVFCAGCHVVVSSFISFVLLGDHRGRCFA